MNDRKFKKQQIPAMSKKNILLLINSLEVMPVLPKLYSVGQVTPISFLDNWFNLLIHIYSAPVPSMHWSSDTIQKSPKKPFVIGLFSKRMTLSLSHSAPNTQACSYFFKHAMASCKSLYTFSTHCLDTSFFFLVFG